MKRSKVMLVSCFVLLPCVTTGTFRPLEVTIEPVWKNLDPDPETIKEFGGKWVLAATIELKKRSPETIKLDQLILNWNGNKLDNLLASLYKKDVDKELVPIEDNLICDSSWDQTNQKLILKFDRMVTVEAHTTLCLVLTIPQEVETRLTSGQFLLETAALPLPLKQALNNQPVAVAMKA